MQDTHEELKKSFVEQETVSVYFSPMIYNDVCNGNDLCINTLKWGKMLRTVVEFVRLIVYVHLPKGLNGMRWDQLGALGWDVMG